MEDFQMLITSTVSLFKTPITIYGFTFNFWEVFLFSLVVGIVLWFIQKAFDD